MMIVHIASEIAPTAKVGGLADVLLGLAREQSWKGRNASVLLPHYACIDKHDLSEPLHHSSFGIWWGGTWWGGACEERLVSGDCKLLLIDSDHPQNYFKRSQVYGFDDDADRFAHFSRACLDYMVTNGIKPDVLHLHDWQASLCAWLARAYPFHDHFKDTKIVLTIHNLEYQGIISRHALDLAGVDGNLALARGLVDQKSTHANLLRGALLTVDNIIAVSPTYAHEIQTVQGGKGLDEVLRLRRDHVTGILNGLDFTYWNPQTDPHLEVRYSLSDGEDLFAKKLENKRALQKKLHLQKSDRPLVACITRLVPQKGVELIKHALLEAHRLKYQMVLVGSTHDPETTREFHDLQEHYSQDPHIRLVLSRDEGLAHQVFAASDIMLVPSLFEPCGLTQLIAFRYGSVPIVRKTGGLADTVIDVEQNEGNGFVFEDPTKEAFTKAIERALGYWKNSKSWQALVAHDMGLDFSWNIPENKYYRIYKNSRS